MLILNADQLLRGDMVRSYPETNCPWTTMCVERIERVNGIVHVTFFRPYVIPQYTILGDDRCVPLIGVEHFTAPCHSGHQWVLIKRNVTLSGEMS